MKTLQAFWRWVDNEKPGTFTIIQKACRGKALTPLARTALDCAADIVWEMHQSGPVGYSIRSALDGHRDDLRDISLALCPALEKVVERRGAVVEQAPEPVKCAGCGLDAADEPSVLHPRPDGIRRCNDCAREAGQAQAPAPVNVVCSCRLVYHRSLTRCPRCNRGTYLNVANDANAALVEMFRVGGAT